MADILPNMIAPPRRKREKYRFRLALRAALRSATFEQFLTAIIILYALSLCALSYLESMAGDYGFQIHLLKCLDMAIFQMFCVELAIKFFAFRRSFFRNGWNVFDASVIIVSIIGMAASITAFRSLRVLRTLRLVKRVPSMRVVIESFMHSGHWLGFNRHAVDDFCLCAHWAKSLWRRCARAVWDSASICIYIIYRAHIGRMARSFPRGDE